MARFGRMLISRFNADDKQRGVMIERAAAAFPALIFEIDALVARIAQRVASLPPTALLQRGWWYHSMAVLGIGVKSDDKTQTEALRMVDYIQSVIASVPPAADQASEVSEEQWEALRTDVVELFATMAMRYPLLATAARLAADPEHDMALEQFQTRAEGLWMHVRGERYHQHENQALVDELAPHADDLERVFVIGARGIADELAKILAKLTGGLAELRADMDTAYEAALARMTEISVETGEEDYETLRKLAMDDEAIADRFRRVHGSFVGLDLFDVALNTKLPPALAEALSYAPGEEKEFFAPGPFAGWPLRVWPSMKRPFIRLDGRIYCFDMFALFDNFYRVLQRLIFRLDPEYKSLWNERQQAVSEALPFAYLERILPGATVYRPVYYRWKAGDGPAQWHEADGLLVYDDHLMVVEVKAGAFTYTSPATDLPAHIASLRNLMLSPARQGGRFLDYLESAPEVALYDADHREIARIRRADFRSTALLAITLDSFTDLAAKAQHLRQIGIDLGERPVWSLSIDDLRAYADLFADPLTFLHFVEQRIEAADSELVELHDELEHLGLYLAENHYRRFAAEITGSKARTMGFIGYRSAIDTFFSAMLQGENPEVPRQAMPTRIAEMVAVLSRKLVPGRSMLASFILDADGEQRANIASAIDEALIDHRTLGRTRPFSSYGEHEFTLVVSSPLVPRDAAFAREFVQSILGNSASGHRLLIEVECDASGAIRDIHWSFIGLGALSATEVARHQAGERRIVARRLATARAKGKIRVNDQCPCGSGRKYKKCHGKP